MYGRLDRLERIQRGLQLDDLPVDGPTGWYEFRPEKFAPRADALWYWTLDRSAQELAGDTPPWVRFLDGKEPGYPEAGLRADLETRRSKVEGMRADHRSADMLMSDDMNGYNPATTDVLTRPAPGAGARLTFALHRYVNRPTLSFSCFSAGRPIRRRSRRRYRMRSA